MVRVVVPTGMFSSPHTEVPKIVAKKRSISPLLDFCKIDIID
jgi:hypothetical protein